jgi:flagellar biosynthesis chaperone FliJ
MSRETVVEQARLACASAKQKCESLERFRDKARHAFDAAEAEVERKLLDELATRRFVTGSRRFQGVSS